MELMLYWFPLVKSIIFFILVCVVLYTIIKVENKKVKNIVISITFIIAFLLSFIRIDGTNTKSYVNEENSKIEELFESRMENNIKKIDSFNYKNEYNNISKSIGNKQKENMNYVSKSVKENNEK